METTYHFKYSKSSWGISIWLTGEIFSISDYKKGGLIRVSPFLCIALETSLILSLEEFNYLVKGLQLVADEITKKMEEKTTFVIKIVKLEFALTDYQPEGLAYAVANWLAQEFHFTFTGSPIIFDKINNRYIFSFPNII